MPARRRVALLIETSNRYGRSLLHGIRHWMQEHERWSVRLLEQARGASVPAWLKGWDGDGIIARIEDSESAQALAALKKPVVDVSAGTEDLRFPRVITDSQEAIAMALRHLQATGLERFGYVGDARFHWSYVRQQCFEAAFNPAQGLAQTYPAVADLRPEQAIRHLADWLRGLELPVGLIACYDARGQQVLEACQWLGLRVPEQVAVVGIHNDALLCELCDPPLSSVEPDARLAGYRAATLLQRLMRHESLDVQFEAIEPLRVVTRQSTDLVAVSDPSIAQAVRFMREHATAGINVEDVLKHVPMARTHFERRFKALLKMTPRAYIEALRIQRIKELLTQTALPVARIAEQTGYDYPEYMTHVFRRREGITPLHYRRKHRRWG